VIHKIIISLLLSVVSISAFAADPTPAVQYTRDSNYIYAKEPLRVTFDAEQQVALEQGVTLIKRQIEIWSSRNKAADPSGDLQTLQASAQALSANVDKIVASAGHLYGDVAPAGFNAFQSLPSAVVVFGGAAYDKNVFKFVNSGGSILLGAVLVPMKVTRVSIKNPKDVKTYISWTDNSALVVLPTFNAGAALSTDGGAQQVNVRAGIGLVWGELNNAKDLVGVTGGGSVTLDVGPGVNLKALALKNINKPGFANNFILLAGLQKKPTAGSQLPLISLNAESSFNLGVIVDATAVLTSGYEFMAGVADRVSGVIPKN
jgi:hypothetical protein